ncbi:MAG: glycosyl hydrolase family 18 protein [Patescibacteria group bacterium]
MSKSIYIVSFGFGALILGGLFLYRLALNRPVFTPSTQNSTGQTSIVQTPVAQTPITKNQVAQNTLVQKPLAQNTLVQKPPAIKAAASSPPKANLTPSVAPKKTISTAAMANLTSSSKVIATAPAAPSFKSTELMAWIYPGGQSCSAKTEYSDGRKIKILKAEYFKLGDSGQLILIPENKGACNGYSAANVSSLKKYSQEQYATVSSADASVMDQFLTAALQDNTDIKTLVDFTVNNNITGIELDFEDFGGWSAPTYLKYKQFITKLGNALHAQKKKLIVDGPATSNAVEEAWYVWRYADFNALPVDRLVVMTYDYQYDQGSGEPIAPISWLQNTIKWTLGRFPNKAKLSVGIPAYGYKGTIGTQKFTLMTYEQIKKEPGFSTAQRDPNSFEMTWRNGNNVYFYQDGVSMTKKLQVIQAAGISSVSVWHLGGNLWFK